MFVDFEKIKQEFSKIKDMDSFKHELSRLGQEIGLEIVKLNSTLAPQAKKNLEAFEKRYNEVLKLITERQKQLDKEFSRARELLKQTRTEVEKRLEHAKKTALTQKKRFEKLVSQQMKKQKKRGKRKSSAGTTSRPRRTKAAKASAEANGSATP